MTTVEMTGMLDEHHRLQLDEDLPVAGPMRVRVLVMYPLDEESASDTTGTVPGPEVAEDLQRDPNYLAYERERETLESDHQGKYVAYCRGGRVALAESNAEIFSMLDARCPDEACFVKQISDAPRRVVFRRPRKMRPRFASEEDD